MELNPSLKVHIFISTLAGDPLDTWGSSKPHVENQCSNAQEGKNIYSIYNARNVSGELK